ncbi:hypothetical protein KDM41_14965 [bacterium]|nr:hypothetical protein [bacterium]
MIEATRDEARSLTTFTCTGTPSPEEVESRLRDFYSTKPTLHTIWDFSGADLSALTADRISELAAFLKKAAHSRSGGRAALVYTLAQIGTLTDRLPAMAELSIADATLKVFDDLAKAEHWVFAE